MRYIKLAIISFVLIFLLVTVISLFIPSHIRISKALDIQNSGEVVMNYIRDPGKWKEWFPGADTLKLLYKEGKPNGILLNQDTEEGLSIIEQTDSSVMATNIGPGVKRQLETAWIVYQTGAGNNVTVQWYMDFHFRWYPWEKFSSLFYENIYGAEMEKGLEKLKQAVENAAHQ